MHVATVGISPAGLNTKQAQCQEVLHVPTGSSRVPGSRGPGPPVSRCQGLQCPGVQGSLLEGLLLPCLQVLSCASRRQLEALLWRLRHLGVITAHSVSPAYMGASLYQGGMYELEHGVCITAHGLGLLWACLVISCTCRS